MSTRTHRRLALIMISILCVASPTAAAADRQRVFQQGAAGYNGVRDTWVSRADWDTPKQYTLNHGQSDQLLLGRDGGGNPLLRFDLAAIPANSRLASATLYLYNSTNAACDKPGTESRTVELFRVVRDWDEGNQVSSPIDAAGKHGTTGDLAFAWFAGEGANVPWGGRGLVAVVDYAVRATTSTEVLNAGWYQWDITDMVRRHIRGELPNFGMVLRDATGRQDNNCDWRSFVSSQAGDQPRRPKLVVTYNPQTPFADAGPDQDHRDWNGAPVTLDGAGSHDRPGGNDATLRYSWRVAEAAYGSVLDGAVLGNTRSTTFRPDVAGEWDLELQVTNDLNESAQDLVHVRVLGMSAANRP